MNFFSNFVGKLAMLVSYEKYIFYNNINSRLENILWIETLPFVN